MSAWEVGQPRPYVGHFVDPDSVEVEKKTLCGQPWNIIVWRSNRRADCMRCQDIWMDRGWEFPLPEICTFDEVLA